MADENTNNDIGPTDELIEAIAQLEDENDRMIEITETTELIVVESELIKLSFEKNAPITETMIPNTVNKMTPLKARSSREAWTRPTICKINAITAKTPPAINPTKIRTATAFVTLVILLLMITVITETTPIKMTDNK